MPDSDICRCGHLRSEHLEASGDYYECMRMECECEDFRTPEPDEEEEEEEENASG